MHKMVIIPLVVLLFLASAEAFGSEDEAKNVEQLSARVEELNRELQKLTAELKDAVKAESADEAEAKLEADASEKNAESATQQEINTLLERIDKLAKAQDSLSEELQEMKKSDEETVTYVDSDGNEVELGVVEGESASSGSVLENYGNANEYSGSDGVVYVKEEPEYIVVPQRKPKVGISFYFGSPRYRYNRWNNPWAVDPPWRVRRNHRYNRHWHHRRW